MCGIRRYRLSGTVALSAYQSTVCMYRAMVFPSIQKRNCGGSGEAGEPSQPCAGRNLLEDDSYYNNWIKAIQRIKKSRHKTKVWAPEDFFRGSFTHLYICCKFYFRLFFYIGLGRIHISFYSDICIVDILIYDDIFILRIFFIDKLIVHIFV